MFYYFKVICIGSPRCMVTITLNFHDYKHRSTINASTQSLNVKLRRTILRQKLIIRYFSVYFLKTGHFSYTRGKWDGETKDLII